MSPRHSRVLKFSLPLDHNQRGAIPGRVVGMGPAPDVKAERAKLPLFLQLFGVLPCFDKTQPRRALHAHKTRRAGVDRSRQYRDAHGVWQDLPPSVLTARKARKLGFKGSWRSPSLKPGHALKREHAARVRAKLAEP